MKQLLPKFLFAAGILVFGITALVFFTNKVKQAEPEPDLIVYSIDFCKLAENPQNYDWKLVRIKGISAGMGTDTPVYLTSLECQQRIYITSKMDFDSDMQMVSKMQWIYAQKNPALLPRIEVIGRFRVGVDNPLKNHELYKDPVNLIEITELKAIETVPKTPNP